MLSINKKRGTFRRHYLDDDSMPLNGRVYVELFPEAWGFRADVGYYAPQLKGV